MSYEKESIIRRNLKSMILTGFLAAVFMLLFLPVNARAAGFRKVMSESYKATTFRCDMTGDGVKEKITVTPQGKIYDYCYQKIRVSVNGHTAATIKTQIEYCVLDVTYINLSASKQFLQINAYNENGWVSWSAVYRYEKSGKKLVRVLSLNEWDAASCERNGDSVIKVTSNTIQIKRNIQIFETGFIEWYATYTYSGGKFKLKSNSGLQCWYPSDNWFTATRKLTFYKTSALSSKAFTVHAGDRVKLVGIKTVGKKIYLKFKYGNKTGWQKGRHSYTSVFKNGTGWFREVRLAG